MEWSRSSTESGIGRKIDVTGLRREKRCKEVNSSSEKADFIGNTVGLPGGVKYSSMFIVVNLKWNQPAPIIWPFPHPHSPQHTHTHTHTHRAALMKACKSRIVHSVQPDLGFYQVNIIEGEKNKGFEWKGMAIVGSKEESKDESDSENWWEHWIEEASEVKECCIWRR